ncbi:ankyrin repeat-containing domain protein [Melanogaster broomeanus]|nr:ankyrin repeat-containing domain protein [Melanogaster broomeanus]
MDPFSTTATAIQLFQVAMDVSNALRQYIAAVRGAKSSCSELIERIALISKAAQAAQSVLENSPPPLISNPGAASPPYGMVQNQTGGHKFTRGVKKLMWPGKEKRIRAAIQTFEGHLPYFRDMLSISTASWVRGIYSGRESEREHNERRKLLKWLDGLNCTVKHETTSKLRQGTTGEWLLNEKLYMDWRSSSIRFLWLAGKPGAGKSVLASTIIDNISSGLANNETLAYFYCDFGTPKSTRIMEILRSLTVQFLRNSKSDWLSSKPFSELVTRKEQGAKPPVDIDINFDLLRHAAKLHQRPMIVVDALDECDDLKELLHELKKLDVDGHCRVFVTARPLHCIHGSFAGMPSISLDDRVDAVRKDMYIHINAEVESRDKLKTFSHDLQEEIRVALMDKADGMFRLVQLQLDRLNGCWSLGDLQEAMETLPGTLYETYDRMLRAIDKKEFGGPIARRALMWLVTALGPLTLSQLAEALAINVDKPALDSTLAPMRKTGILEICGSFVSHDKETGIITLSHYSVKEFLTSNDIADKTYFVDRPRASFELASVSIYSIMLFIDEHSIKGRDWEGLESEDCLSESERRLFGYATLSGFHHLENCIPEYNDSLLGILVTLEDHVSNHRRSYATLLRDRIYEHWWMTWLSQLALYIIIRFGHVSMLRHYLDHHSIQVRRGANPLVYAALYADVPRFQMLLDSGLDVNLEAILPTIYSLRHNENILHIQPLTAATFNEDQELLMLLVRRTMVPRDAIHSVLQVPYLYGVPWWNRILAPSTIALLLQHGADATLSVAGGDTCLHLLVERSSEHQSGDLLEIAGLLVEAGANPAALNDEGLSPFHLALRNGVLQFVQWLIAKGLRPPPDAILHAARSSGEDLPIMFHLLFECGIAIDIEDDDGNNAFHILSGSYVDSIDTLKLLLDKGCNIDHRNHRGETPLYLAAEWGNFAHIEFLINQGAQLPDDIINLAGGDTCLHLLAGRWYGDQSSDLLEITGLLVEAGADPAALNDGGLSPFHVALRNGVLQFVQWLIAKGLQPPPDAILHAARSSGEDLPTMFHLLFECGVTVDIKDDDGNNAFHILSGSYVDSVDTLKLLLDKGCNIDHRNHWGETPLYLAAEQGNFAHIEFLIDQGAQLPDDIINRVCRAVYRRGSTSVVALLARLVKKHGASCQAWTAHGDNALHVLLGQEMLLL